MARVALALGSGFTLALALPPWGWWPLAILGVIGLEFAIDPSGGARHRFAIGAVFAIGWLAMGMGWMWFFTAPGYLVAVIFFAVFFGAATAITPPGRGRVIARPAALAIAEAVRFAFPFGGVPLAGVALTQVGGPMATAVRTVGVIGLAWLVFQLGTSIGVALRRPADDGRRPALAGLAGVAVVLLASTVAPAGRPTGETMRIAAVQGGGEQGTSALEVPSRLVTERHLAATRSIDDDGLDLVLWPENTIRAREVAFDDSRIAADLAVEADRLRAPITVGITEDADLTGIGDVGQVTNAQVVVTPEGEVVARYDKVRRVPFGEYVPLRGVLETLGLPVDQVRTDAVAGRDPAVLGWRGGPLLGVVISWEVFFPDRARDAVTAGGRVLLNPTNGASYTGTIVQSQQVASSRLRAIESGRWVVQAAPTGFSAFISPTGEVSQRTSVGEQAVIIDEVELRDGLTLHVRFGDVPVIAAAIVMIGIGWWTTRRSRPVTTR